MAAVKPFRALRPRADLAERICELPYDVMSSAEARVMAAGNPWSFLHVSKPEIDLDAKLDASDPQVYARGRGNFDRLIKAGALQRENRPCFYLYRQVMGAHSQVGLVGVASCEDYLKNVIKKHELTRPDKELDRVRHIEALEAQTGPAFLVYRANPSLEGAIAPYLTQQPGIDFVAKDGVRHSSWTISEPTVIQRIEAEFKQMPALYIADGHHRSAAAARVWEARQGRGESGFFLSVIFSHSRVNILPYNRVLKDLNGLSPAQLRQKLESIFDLRAGASARPSAKHQVAFYFQGAWTELSFRPSLWQNSDPVEGLDASLLQKHVLAPVFGVDNPRTSDRISFVGGIRGTGELEKLVDGGHYACAFSLYPTTVEDLMAVADAGGLMPPKSTWFEPKLRDGMFSHSLDG
jgi:uncharacterized protein (DUF1015 family)